MRADHGRHFRLSLPAGRTLHEGLVEALAREAVHSASMTLLGGDLESLSFCMALPDPSGRVLATYGAPVPLRGARLIFGNATLGRSASNAPLVHCHGAFCEADGAVRGGHILCDRSVVGRVPVTVSGLPIWLAICLWCAGIMIASHTTQPGPHGLPR